jgi:hypothetical protein
MKVFYKRQTWAPPHPGEPEKADVDEVAFPIGLFEELERVLRESQYILPVGAREFQGWEVGLVERFDIEESRVEVDVVDKLVVDGLEAEDVD